MTPTARITVDGVDVSNTLLPRLLSLRVQDEAGFASDSVELTMDDRALAIALPSKGVKLRIWLGYKEESLFYKGEYTVDEVRHRGPPATIVITAKGADFLESLKSRKTRSWHATTIGVIVQTISAEHDLKPRVEPALAATAIEHIDQTDESDLHFLARLAKQYDAIARPINGFLIFLPKGQAKTAEGQALTRLTLRPSDLKGWEYVQQERQNYRKVTAYWTDKSDGQRKEEYAGEGAPAKALRTDYPNAAEAKAAAEAELRRIQRGKATFNLNVEGLPEAASDWRVIIADFKPELDGEWSVHRAEHVLSDAGLSTDLEMEIPSET